MHFCDGHSVCFIRPIYLCISVNMGSVCEKDVLWFEILCQHAIVTAAKYWVELHMSCPTINIVISGSFNGADFPFSCPLLHYNSYHVPQMSVAQPLFNKLLL